MLAASGTAATSGPLGKAIGRLTVGKKMIGRITRVVGSKQMETDGRKTSTKMVSFMRVLVQGMAILRPEYLSQRQFVREAAHRLDRAVHRPPGSEEMS